MLHQGQEIIYYRNGKEFAHLTEGTIFSEEDWKEIRYHHPFLQPGERLDIPRGNGNFWFSRPLEKTARRENKLIYSTLNSIYEIEYKNIDLEKILDAGRNKGINKPDTGKKKFPPL